MNRKREREKAKADPSGWNSFSVLLSIYHIFMNNYKRMAGIHILFPFESNTDSTCTSRRPILFTYFVCGYDQLQNVPRILLQDSNRGPWYEICIALLEREERNKSPIQRGAEFSHRTKTKKEKRKKKKSLDVNEGFFSCFPLSTTPRTLSSQTRTRPHLVIVYLPFCHSEYQQDVVFHHLINELTESWVLLGRKKR